MSPGEGRQLQIIKAPRGTCVKGLLVAWILFIVIQILIDSNLPQGRDSIAAL